MDVPDLLEVPKGPDGDPDVWRHLHSTGFWVGWVGGLDLVMEVS